jgi:hypothetical protein
MHTGIMNDNFGKIDDLIVDSLVTVFRAVEALAEKAVGRLWKILAYVKKKLPLGPNFLE